MNMSPKTRGHEALTMRIALLAILQPHSEHPLISVLTPKLSVKAMLVAAAAFRRQGRIQS